MAKISVSDQLSTPSTKINLYPDYQWILLIGSWKSGWIVVVLESMQLDAYNPLGDFLKEKG